MHRPSVRVRPQNCLARHFDLTEREILIDMPVARFVGVGECAPGDVASNAQVIEFGLVSAQTGFDVAKALAIRQLREGQAEKLAEMRKLECWISTWGVGYALTERMQRQVPYQLRKHQFPYVHMRTPDKSQKFGAS